jgi:hypothetical protein
MITVLEQPGFEPKVHRFRYNAAGLRGKRMRLMSDLPTSDAGKPQESLIGVTDVVCLDETPNVTTYEVRVHPVGLPEIVAFVAFTQLALYDDEQ